MTYLVFYLQGKTKTCTGAYKYKLLLFGIYQTELTVIKNRIGKVILSILIWFQKTIEFNFLRTVVNYVFSFILQKTIEFDFSELHGDEQFF